MRIETDPFASDRHCQEQPPARLQHALQFRSSELAPGGVYWVAVSTKSYVLDDMQA